MDAVKIAVLLAVVAPLTLGACGREDTPAAQSEPPPQPPPHHWIVKEGQEYGYPEEISPTEALAGRAASEVQMFRYMGNPNGDYRLMSGGASGQTLYECHNPCDVIRITLPDYYGSVKHVVFNPSTVIGSAFTDAFNGQLEEYGSVPPQAPSPAAPIAVAPIDATSSATAAQSDGSNQSQTGAGVASPAVDVVTHFYRALESGNVHEAAMMILPEKREVGPFREASLTKFYSSLAGPIQFSDVSSLNDGSVVARYSYKKRDGGKCSTTARIFMSASEEQIYIQNVLFNSRC